MAFGLLIMAGGPGLYDSQRRSASHRQFYHAQRQHEISPSAETKHALDAATQGLEEAKRLDRRDIIFFEAFMLGILAVSVYGFIRAGKNLQKISAAS